MRNTATRLRDVLALHFDEERGAPFWIDRGRELGFDPREEVRTWSDLVKFGPFERRWLVERPLLDFLPRALLVERERLIMVETGGTTGPPVRTAFLPEEFELAFTEPFAQAASLLDFPPGGTWLFLGPTGPHAIGKAARRLARRMGAMEPFTVDFDPRWARAQEAGSLGERLYREHVLEQADAVAEREPIDRLFSTPPLLLELAERWPEPRRLAIEGIHPGGLPLRPEARSRIEDAFPNAKVLPAWGNSLFGILPEVRPVAAGLAEGFCFGGRIHLRLVAEGVDGPDLERDAGTGERGRLVLSRVDLSCFLPNVVERDQAERVDVDAALRDLGFGPVALRDPTPVVPQEVAGGLY